MHPIMPLVSCPPLYWFDFQVMYSTQGGSLSPKNRLGCKVLEQEKCLITVTELSSFIPGWIKNSKIIQYAGLPKVAFTYSKKKRLSHLLGSRTAHVWKMQTTTEVQLPLISKEYMSSTRREAAKAGWEPLARRAPMSQEPQLWIPGAKAARPDRGHLEASDPKGGGSSLKQTQPWRLPLVNQASREKVYGHHRGPSMEQSLQRSQYFLCFSNLFTASLLNFYHPVGFVVAHNN